MCNETCTVTIADIYGAEWWERNKAELDREWEWEFGVVKPAGGVTAYAAIDYPGIITCSGGASDPRIILHRRKPKPPTLREVYGVDEVTIPQGWEWTGEWRIPKEGDTYVAVHSYDAQVCHADSSFWSPRLIIKERPKKKWFKAEAVARLPKKGDWYCSQGVWTEAAMNTYMYANICGTLQQEVDCTEQIVSQSDIDMINQ